MDMTPVDGIIIGGAGGAIAGLTVWVTQLGQAWLLERRDRLRVYNWLRDQTADRTRKQFRSTRSIASWTNLTEDRVRYVCSIHPKVYLSTGDREDMWGLLEHTPRKA